MLKRLCLGSLVVAAAGSAVLVAAAPAHSDRSDWPEGPAPHGHLHLNGAVTEGHRVLSFEGCRELANGEVVPRSAHHENLHAGRANEAQRQAGNAIVPLAPITAFESCEDLAEAVYGPSS